MLIVAVISFPFMFIYQVNRIKVHNPKGFNEFHYKPISQLTTEQSNVKLIQHTTLYSYYFSSMLFIGLTILCVLFYDTWLFDTRITMAFIGFNLFALFIHILEDVHSVIVK